MLDQIPIASVKLAMDPMFSKVSIQVLGQLQRVKILTGLVFFECLQPRVGAVAAGEGVVGEEWHQLPQLQRDAGLVVEQ